MGAFPLTLCFMCTLLCICTFVIVHIYILGPTDSCFVAVSFLEIILKVRYVNILPSTADSDSVGSIRVGVDYTPWIIHCRRSVSWLSYFVYIPNVSFYGFLVTLVGWSDHL